MSHTVAKVRAGIRFRVLVTPQCTDALEKMIPHEFSHLFLLVLFNR